MASPRYRAISKTLLASGLLLYAFLARDLNETWITAVLAALAALTLWFAWRDWHRPPSAEDATPVKPPSLRATFIACGIVLAADVIWFGAPALGAYAAMVLVLWLVPRILVAWREPALRRHRGRVALIVLAVLVFDGAVYAIYEVVAQRRVTEVAEALVRFRARLGNYPERLQALVPEYLPAVPSAKPGLVMMGSIWYHSTPGGATALMYVSFPPFYRKVLDIDTLQWTVID